MRKNIVQILKEGKIDIENEYRKFYDILYQSNNGQKSLYQTLSDYFLGFYFRGTCLELDEFNQQHGFKYDVYPDNITIYDLVGFIEYIYNLIFGYQGAIGGYNTGSINVNFFYDQINRVAEAIGYMATRYENMTVFVEKSPEAIAVAESDLIPDELSYKLITYNHYSMRGNIVAKKDLILRLANILEGKRKVLNTVNSSLESDLFYIFNNFNLRHNNCDSTGKNYRPVIAQMGNKTLEEWYDEAYQMCLLAFMEIDHAERKEKLNAIKQQMQ